MTAESRRTASAATVPFYPDLHPEQRKLLDAMPFDGSHLVSGPPGSGKSIVAVHRAALLELTGAKVTLVSRSNLLRQQHAEAASVLCPDVRVATFHSLLGDWYRRALGERLPTTAPDGTSGWEIDWPELYARTLAVGTLPPLGALVVDEGQDLPPEFYRLCRIADARLTVLADEHQVLTDTHSTLAEISGALGDCSPWELHTNHRNTRQLASLAAHFHGGPFPPRLPEAGGPSATVTRYPADSDLLREVRQHLEARPRDAVGVVLRSSLRQRRLLGVFQAAGLPVQAYFGDAPRGRYRDLDWSRSGVYLVTRASVKGLTFDALFVPDTHLDSGDPGDPGLRMMYYVLATRPRRHLRFGYEGDREPPLLAGVPRELLRRDAP